MSAMYHFAVDLVLWCPIRSNQKWGKMRKRTGFSAKCSLPDHDKDDTQKPLAYDLFGLSICIQLFNRVLFIMICLFAFYYKFHANPSSYKTLEPWRVILTIWVGRADKHNIPASRFPATSWVLSSALVWTQLPAFLQWQESTCSTGKRGSREALRFHKSRLRRPSGSTESCATVRQDAAPGGLDRMQSRTQSTAADTSPPTAETSGASH